MLKKIISLTLVITLLASFSACTLPTQKPAEAPQDYEAGTVTTGSYESKYLGFGCRLDSNWTFKTEEEMIQTNKDALNMVGDDYANAIKNAKIIYEMMASTATGNSININLEKASVEPGTYLALSMTTVKNALAQIGMKNITAEKGTTQFLGEEASCLFIEGTINGIKLYETLVALKVDDYIVNITVGSVVDNNCDQFLSYFYKL